MKSINLKSVVLGAVFMLASAMAYTQSVQEEVDLIQSVFGMEKKAIMAEFIGDNANDEFWKIYDEYEYQRKQLGQKRLMMLADYADNYHKLDDKKTADLIKTMEKQKKSLDKLIYKYANKIKKASGPTVAAQFYQAENYFLSAIRVSIMDNIPFIGELNPNY